MLDWKRLQSYQVAPHHSFEELCYQIARSGYSSLGKLLSIDDSGGGDGVEFYMTFPNGDVWGWQAKFFPGERLTPGRRRQSEKSLKRAVEVHGGKLKRWFLCVPLNLVSKGKYSEVRWWEEKLPQHAPGVELTFWGESELFAQLQEGGREGIRACFFGDLPLDRSWFDNRLKEQLASVRDKYDAALHTETAIDLEIHSLLADEGFVSALVTGVAKLRASVERLVELTSVFEEELVEAGPPLKQLDTWQVVSLRKIIEPVAKRLCVTAEKLLIASGDRTSDRLELAHNFLNEWAVYQGALREEYGAYRRPERIPYESGTQAGIRQVVESIQEFEQVQRLITRLLQAQVNIIGVAGIGKTHVSCHAVQAAVAKDHPAILLLGSQFRSTEIPQTQILHRLQVPATYSWEAFLGAIDTYAAVRRGRALLVIDALNEAQSPALWRTELPGLTTSIARHPHIALVTTSRPIYREAIWPGVEPPNVVEARGFSASDLKDAVAKYFARYKIVADLRLASLEPFRLPIYLSLFCRSKNEAADTERHVVLGEQTLYEIFDEYLVHADRLIRDRLNRRGVTNLVSPKLARIAGALWQRKLRVLPFDDVCVELDGQLAVDLNWEGSLTHAVLDEGLLLRRDLEVTRGDEVVTFSYDLFAGYQIAKYLVAGKTPAEVEEFIRSRAFEAAVASQDFSEQHPLAEDVLRGLVAVLPRQAGVHLYQISKHDALYSAGIVGLFELPAEQVSSRDASEVRGLLLGSVRNVAVFAAQSTRAAFLPGHPLNTEFFDSVLRSMRMPERDLGWTEAVRHNRETWLEEVEEFEQVCRDWFPGAEPITDARVRLGALRYQWLLTSTRRQLRDATTRSLYWYGRRDPRALFGLAVAAFEIDDPYVRERLLAAGYGVGMALHADPEKGMQLRQELPRYAAQLYQLMFTPGAPHATTHALIRDYAVNTIHLALKHQPELLTTDQVARTIAPFTEGGIRDWGESEDRNAEEYREGNYPFGLDFGNYTVGRLVPGRDNYDSRNPEYQQVMRQMWWRIYELGYSLDRFGEIDQSIARAAPLNRSENNVNRTDRYGKKYAWIAFYEQYGLREDRGDLRSRYEWSDPRPIDVDIDPSFPEAPAEVVFAAEDLLGDRSVHLDDWMRDGPGPDLAPYLVLDELEGESGPWVLLDGMVVQEDREADRTAFAFPRGLLIRREDASHFASSLAAQPLRGRWLPEVPEDHLVFAGEVPWSPTYPVNGWTSIQFGGSRAVPWEATEDDPQVLLPVRHFGWGSHIAGTLRSHSPYVLAREISEPFGFWLRLPSWDFHDRAGRRVARFVSASARGTQYALFMRADALEHVLASLGLALVWGVWGERGVARHEHIMARKATNSDYVVHQAVYLYDGSRPELILPSER